jgi:hypothetical protein
MGLLTNIAFEWPIVEAGYEWIDAHLVRDDWAIEKNPTRVMVPRDRATTAFWHHPTRNPILESGLFLNFAMLPADETSFLGFANEFGILTPGILAVPVGVRDKFPRPPSSVRLSDLSYDLYLSKGEPVAKWANKWLAKGAVIGETYGYWFAEHLGLGLAVAIWICLQERDNKKLGQFVRLEEDGETVKVILLQDDPIDVVSFARNDPRRPRSLLQAGEYALKHMLGHQIAVRVGVEIPECHEPNWGFSLRPRYLSDALVLQFVLAVSEQKSYQKCAICGKSFEITPGIANINRTLCSDACKAKAHRRRQAKAMALAAEGMKPRQIAKEVGSKLETVQNWLQERKEKR